MKFVSINKKHSQSFDGLRVDKNLKTFSLHCYRNCLYSSSESCMLSPYTMNVELAQPRSEKSFFGQNETIDDFQ